MRVGSGDAEPLLHDRAGRGVLQELAFLGEQMIDCEGREGGFMEAAQTVLPG